MAEKPLTVTVHHPKLDRSKVVPNKPGLLRVLGKSGWVLAGPDVKPKGDAGPAVKPKADPKT